MQSRLQPEQAQKPVKTSPHAKGRHNPFRIYGEPSPSSQRQSVLPRPVHPAPMPRPNRKKAGLSGKGLLSESAFVRLKIAAFAALLLLGVYLAFSGQVGRLGWVGPVKPSVVSPVYPLARYYVSSGFGPRWGRQHQGIDLAAAQGSPIYALSAGRVIHSGWESGYGRSVVIDNGHGVRTRYAHCAKLLVSVGNQVYTGQKIAQVGSTGHSTGPHLHFEIIVRGKHRNPAWYYRFDPNHQPEVAPPQTSPIALLSPQSLLAWIWIQADKLKPQSGRL